jgi:(p)ppGpp synthase/HD superfamily hydrolase
LHPLRVGASLHDFGQDYVIAGLLHDVVEDTPATLEDLAALGASDAVVNAVSSVTKTESERTWEAYKKTLSRASQDPVGGWVKAADIADNWKRLDERRLGSDTYARLLSKYEKARVYMRERGFNPDLF